ncbi:MAG: sugar-binding protein [Lentisphaeria bacterium]
MRFYQFILLLSGFFGLWAAELQEYPIYKIIRPPEIDGTLGDYAWSRLPEGRGFRNLDKNNSYAIQRSTNFKMGYTDDFLYLAVDCTEPDLKALRAVETYRDGWTFDDAIELFFLPENTSEYVQLLCNAKAARWAKRQKAERELEPPKEWQVAAGRSEKGWTLEMVIPFQLVGIRDVDQLRFNIARNIPSEKKNKHQCWAKVLRGFSDIEQFAVLKKNRFNGPADITLAATEINREYDQFLYLQLLDIGQGGKSWKEVETRFSSAPGFEKVRALQEWISKNYTRLPKSAYGVRYNEWLNLLASVNTPRRSLEMQIIQQDLSTLQLLVNNSPVIAENGRYAFSIEEGVTVLAFSGKAGENASLRFTCPEFPELEQRWAFSGTASDSDWSSPTFDDRSWQPLPEKIPAGDLYLRQVILWNQKHDGRFRCLNPSVSRWSFSLNSVEPVYLSLYSPTGLTVQQYMFTFTLPDGFQLLDMEEGARRNRLSLAPEKVAVEKTATGTRYSLDYRPIDIHEWKTADSILGIFKDSNGEPGAEGRIPYARLINHNVTEIGGFLPYAILPEINGRPLQKMMMSFYMGSMPQGLSLELTDAVVKGAINAGMDSFSVYPNKGKVPDSVLKNGGKLIMGYLSHPIWGSKLTDGAVTKLFRDHPELFCVYYNGERKTDLDLKIPVHRQQIQFCPTLATGKYQKEFYQAVQEDHQNFFFKDYPQAEYVFLNWEQEPWGGSIYTKSNDPSEAFCFCPLCKEKFRSWAKLPLDADLSNENLFHKYYEKWRQFRYSQDAETHAIIVKAIRDMGKRVYFYSWSNHFGYWEAAKDIPYTIFLGCPGNGSADRRQQIGMDEYMKFHQGKMGRRNLSGQRFIFFPQTYGWNTEKTEGWLKFNVMSEDGYIHPKTWKWQLIRILATLQGGCDLQNPLELVSGSKYYVGEATRLVAEYEEIFYAGSRNDTLALSEQISYPDLLVLTHNQERLVLLFNESEDPKSVTVQNLSLTGKEKGKTYYSNQVLPQVSKFTLTIPANDVEVIHIR